MIPWYFDLRDMWGEIRAGMSRVTQEAAVLWTTLFELFDLILVYLITYFARSDELLGV